MLCVCLSFPESPRLGGEGGTSHLCLNLGGSQGTRPLLGVCLPPVLLEGDREKGQEPPGLTALLQPAPRCAHMRLGTSGRVSSLS